MLTTSATRRSREVEFHTRYVLLALAYAGAIYWLSSLSSLGVDGHHRLVQVGSKLVHVALYGGLAFLLLKGVMRGQATREATWLHSGLAFAASAILAVLDEWHQSFVPGRRASVNDLLLDLIGIAGTLLVVRIFAAPRDAAR